MMREGFVAVFLAIFGKTSFLAKKFKKSLVTLRVVNKDAFARSFERCRTGYFVSVNYAKNGNYACFKAKSIDFFGNVCYNGRIGS